MFNCLYGSIVVEFSGNVGEILLKQLIDYTVFALEALIAMSIIIIVVITLASFFKIALSRIMKREEGQGQQRSTKIHHTVIRMIRGLLISLDFLIAADILKTMLVPSIIELGMLAIIVVIRILLSWSMSKEIQDHRGNGK
jgi:uncharacterized membrane protein